MSLLNFEWDMDSRNLPVLIARKSRGKIFIAELQEEISRDYRYQGGWAVVFKVMEDGYQGWGDMSTSEGDILELYHVDDGEYCPVCAKALADVNFCPYCRETHKRRHRIIFSIG